MSEKIEKEFDRDHREHTLVVEGRNAVLEAFRSGKPIDKVFVLDGCQDGPIRTIIREAKKHDTIINFVNKDRLNQISTTGKHQGVIAYAAAYEYSEVEDMLKLAEEKGEDPFLILLDNIEDPHNLGAIIRTANLAGAHGVIIPKRRAVGLTATVAKTSAGALNYTPVAKVTNLAKTMEELKEKDIDTLIMGCTHYPLLRSTLHRLMGDEVTLVNPAYETAVELKTLLRDMDLTRSSEDLERFSEENSRRAAAGEPILDPYQFFVSDRAENFTRFAKAILPKEVKDTKQINIEEY